MLLESGNDYYKIKTIKNTIGTIDTLVITNGMSLSGPIVRVDCNVYIHDCVIITTNTESAKLLVAHINNDLKIR